MTLQIGGTYPYPQEPPTSPQRKDCCGANLERANSWPPTVHQKLASILNRGQPKLLKTLSIQKWGDLNAIEQRRKLVEP